MRDNSQLYCTVHYTYSEPVYPGFKQIFERQFMRMRDEAVDLLNPHYEEWNAAYNKEVTGEDDMRYNAFIRRKQREILRLVNEKHIHDIPILKFRLDSDEYADIIGVISWPGKEITMHMSIKLINEKEWKEYHRTHG